MANLPKPNTESWMKASVPTPERIVAPRESTRVPITPPSTQSRASDILPDKRPAGKNLFGEDLPTNKEAKKQATKEAIAARRLPLAKGEVINLPGIRSVVDETKEQKKVNLREKLEKFFLNRYIVEPLDHVWIWMTSPSKSLFVLENDQSKTIQKVVEAPDSTIALKLQIDKLTQQMVIKTDQKEQLKREFDAIDKSKEPTKKEQLDRQIRSLDIETSAILKRLESLGKAVVTYNFNKSTDTIFANRTIDLTDPENKGNQMLEKLSSEFQGLSEQQFQVFEGVVLDVTETYSDGKYTLGVKCKDVLYYLESSRIMSKPGLQGSSTIDPSYEVNTPIIEKGEKRGLWKTGMLVRTSEDKTKEVDSNPGVLIAAQPFAKSDAANIISFLILGIPYNVELFVKNGISDGRLIIDKKAEIKSQVSGSDTVVGEDRSEMLGGYFGVIRSQLGLQNAQLGDFKPFTLFDNNLSTFEASVENIKKDIVEIKSLVVKILKDKKSKTPSPLDPVKDKEFIDKLKKFDLINTAIEGNELTDAICNLYVEENRTSFPLEAEFKKLGLTFQILNTQGTNALYALYGKRELLNALESAGKIFTDKDVKKEEFQAFLNGNVKQREDIINNRDVNYLMISSEYTMDNNLEAFNYMMGEGNWSMWQSEFEMPLQTCKKAAEIINWEFFADELGNIRFESSKYNRILKEHLPRLFSRILIKNPDGSIADPVGQGLWNKFQNNEVVKALVGKDARSGYLVKYKEEVVKLGELRNKLSSVTFYEREVETAQKRVANLDNGKKDLQEEIKKIKGWIPKFEEAEAQTNEEIITLIDKATGSFLMSRSEKALDITKTSKSEKLLMLTSWIEDCFNISQGMEPSLISEIEFKVKSHVEEFYNLRYKEEDVLFNISRVWTDSQINNEGKNELTIILYRYRALCTSYTDLISRIYFDKQDELDQINKLTIDAKRQVTENQATVDKNKKIEQDYFTSLQTVANLENSIDQAKLDLSASDELHMLTDDTRIHRIPEAIIISSSFTETKPTFTRLDVSGEPNLVDEKVAQDTIYLAAGVDFDLWRTYGYISNSISVPFFHNSALCKPYNEILLGRQWGLIFSGELTVRGDSKYKLNDTVYIESRDMYFRIAGISHSFVYGSSYQTSLTLDYGRRPEFIIPDPWDLLGKITIDAANNVDNTSPQIPLDAVEFGSKEAKEAKIANAKVESEKNKVEGTTTVSKTEDTKEQVNQGNQKEAVQNQKEAEKKEGLDRLRNDIEVLKREYWKTEGEVGDVENKITESIDKEEKIVEQVQKATPEALPGLYEQIQAEGRERKTLNQKLVQLNTEMDMMNKEFQKLKDKAKSQYNYAPYRANIWD